MKFKILLCLVLISVSCAGRRAAPLTVSAAADLTPAFTELGRRFTAETGIEVTFNFGSTGQLAQQIEQGAPVDLFAAANVSFIDGLEQAGRILPETKTLYARGRIVIWTRSDGRLELKTVADLAHEEVRRIAIANPEHAPYGMAAREALQQAGVWDQVKPKLVFGENVRQTLQYAETGNVDAAIVALSLAIESDGGNAGSSGGGGGGGRWTLIPEQMHRPLDQALAVVRGAKNAAAARRFADFINGAQGRPVMRRYGFLLPGEASP